MIVTFTVAARDELRSRLHEQAVFASTRDFVEVTTLNSWGFRRVKSAAFSPKLITSKTDFHFAMLNQLQGVWMNHVCVKRAIDSAQNTAPRKLLAVMDAFKSLGFDHTRHVNCELFSAHIAALRNQGLSSHFQGQIEELNKLNVLDGNARTPANDKKLTIPSSNSGVRPRPISSATPPSLWKIRNTSPTWTNAKRQTKGST